MADTVLTPIFRLSYPHLFTPQKDPQKPDDAGKYGIAMVFDVENFTEKDKERWKAMQNSVKQALAEFKNPPTVWRNPFRKGVAKSNENPYGFDLEKNPYYEGRVIVNARNSRAPGIMHVSKKIINDPNEMYSGCWCIAQVQAFKYSHAMNTGVAFSLQNILKVKDDEPLAGMQQRPEDAFSDALAEFSDSDLSAAISDDMFDDL